MALTAPGIGSGLDVNGMVSQLMTLERRPLTALAQREAGVQGRISAFGQLAGLISTLQSSANGLKTTNGFEAMRATPGAGAGFSATASSEASAATYNIEVKALAQTQRLAAGLNAFVLDNSDPAITDRIAAGTLDIRFGNIANDLSAETPQSVAFAGGTINELRDAINAADIGVRASVINDGSTQRLILSGTETGLDQGFTLTGLGLSPADIDDTPGAPVQRLQAAGNAEAVVDGLTITRPTNTFADVIDGVSLTLNKADPGVTASLAIAADSSSATAAINNFVKSYNDILTGIKNLTAYNPETRQGSLLTGDSTTRNMQNQLRNLVGGVFEGLGNTTQLSDIGLTFQLDGSLSVDTAQLNAALADPGRAVGAFFKGTDGSEGFGERVAIALGNFVGSEGLLTQRSEGLKASVRDIESRREQIELRLESVEARLRAQFSSLDSMIASMTQTSTFLSQQLAALPGARSQ